MAKQATQSHKELHLGAIGVRGDPWFHRKMWLLVWIIPWDGKEIKPATDSGVSKSSKMEKDEFRAKWIQVWAWVAPPTYFWAHWRIQNKYYLGVCPLCLSSPPGLVWPKYYATLNSIFHPSAVLEAAPFLDFCWPVLFPLYKCDFSEVDCKHYFSPVLNLNYQF